MQESEKPKLEKFMKTNKIVKREFAQTIGVSESQLSHWLNTKKLIPYRFKSQIEAKYKLKLPDNYYAKKTKEIMDCLKPLLKGWGSKGDLAKHLGIDNSTLSHHISKGNKMPKKYVPMVCKYFKNKVTPRDLRPDLFP